VFIIVGLELPYILKTLHQHSTSLALAHAIVISAVVIAVRLVLVFPRHYLAHGLGRWRGDQEPRRPWQQLLLIGWAGMRGGESLVIALALPLATDSGAPFPWRGLIIFLTFSVILATLVLQGLSLHWVTRKLGRRRASDVDTHERRRRNRR
jgi:NhaP-type Na+/H+ or K+/H+ antiporter